MQNDNPVLFIEINETNYIFVAGIYDDNHNLKILETIITPTEGMNKNKFDDINNASKIIKKNVELIEKKINHIFKYTTIIIDNFECTCVNVSGYKKLNGSQVRKENISYILNSLKSAVSQNEKQKTILHIFNSRNILDGTVIENLPIDLFGDFYNHELSFFLIKNNDLKNIRQIFSKSNLNIKKIFLKSFSEGSQLINENEIKTFFKIKIKKDTSTISYFDESSFRFLEQFNFGTNIILKDVEKICSLSSETIKNIIHDGFLKNKIFNDNDLLDKKYFKNKNYRKIKKRLILDIINARIEEIVNLIIYKNINFKFFNENKVKIYLIIQDLLVSDNFKENFVSFFSINADNEVELVDDFKVEETILNTSSLLTYGWKKEAVPITQTKKSLITRIFMWIFD